MLADALPLVLFADRIGLNLAALLFIGSALHFALGVVERDAIRSLRWMPTAAGVGVLAFAGLRLIILNAQMGDGTTLFDPNLIALSWTALGPSTTALGLGLLLGATSILAGSRILAGVGAVALSIGFGLTGHTRGLAEPGLAPLMVITHVLIAGFWIAAPITLFPHAKTSDEALLERLQRFSKLAIVAIPLLIVLGVWLAWVLAGGIEPLFVSSYGRLLLLKLALGLGAMALGALNKQVLTARIVSDSMRGRRWLRLTLRLEMILFLVAILAVSAATTILGPVE